MPRNDILWREILIGFQVWPLPVCDVSAIGILNDINKSWMFLNAKV
jgi:hypothetical protein